MKSEPRALIFPTTLGWMSLVGDGRIVSRLSFGHPNPRAALVEVSGDAVFDDRIVIDDAAELDAKSAASGRKLAALVRRLQRYADGVVDDFRDVKLSVAGQTPFQRRVDELCRRIPFGSSLTYGELAEQAGHPRAARAVGNCMRTHRVPLIVPCHRVVGAGRPTHGDSACERVRMKLRRLEMEAMAGVA